MFTILLFLPILKGSFVATARNYERNKCLHTCVHTVSTTNECARLTCTMTDWLTDRLGEKERDEAERVKRYTVAIVIHTTTSALIIKFTLWSKLRLFFSLCFSFSLSSTALYRIIYLKSAMEEKADFEPLCDVSESYMVGITNCFHSFFLSCCFYEFVFFFTEFCLCYFIILAVNFRKEIVLLNILIFFFFFYKFYY